MRRRKDERVRSSAGHVGSQGVRKSRLDSRNAAHSVQSDICGARSTMPSPTIAGIRSEKLTVRKKAMDIRRQTTDDRRRKGKYASVCLLSSVVRLLSSDITLPGE